MPRFTIILLLAIAAYSPAPVFADGIAVSPEFPIDPDGSNNPKHASVAWDGRNFMVVWQDVSCLGDTQTAIFGARIDFSGQLIDTKAIPISIDSLNADTVERVYPKISYGDGMYLVVWEHPGGLYDNCDVYAARIDTAGNLLDPEGILIHTGSYTYPSVCWDGSRWFVVWHDEVIDNDIFGAWVDPSGTVLNPGGMAISTSGGHQTYPRVCWGGDKYFVIWNDDRLHPPYVIDIFGARVEPDGNVLESEGIRITAEYGYQWYGAVASSGKQYFAFWTDIDGYYNDVYGARIDASGEVLDSSAIPVCTLAIHQGVGDVCWDNTNYLVVWRDNRDGQYDIYGARITPSGEMLEPEGFPVSNLSVPEVAPTLAHAKGKRNIVLYQRTEPEGLYGRIITDNDSYIEGDASGDGSVDIGDVVFLVSYLYRQGPPPGRVEAGDANGDCILNLGDVTYLINYLYKQGPPPQVGCA
jgi:hypothetical protein